MATEPTRPAPPAHEFSAAEIGALAHLYCCEVYRSTIWRTRVHNKRNWAVVALGMPPRPRSPVPKPRCCLVARWRPHHRVSGLRGAALPLLQCLGRARARRGMGDALLRSHAARRGREFCQASLILANDYCGAAPPHKPFARHRGCRCAAITSGFLGILALAYVGKNRNAPAANCFPL